MSTLLKKAMKEIEALPASEQDAFAEMLYVHLTAEPRYHLTPVQIKRVQQTRRDLRSGKTRMVSNTDMEAFWKSMGL